MKALPLLFILFTVSANAQFCETVTDSAWSARFDALLAQRDPVSRAFADTGVVDVPVLFHVQTQNTAPVISLQRINDALRATNEWFFAAGVRFVRCGEVQYYAEGSSPAFNNRAVNVSMYKAASGCGYESGGSVHINVNCNRTLENILSHELGHVLGLPHTHGYTNSGTTDELVDGSNCATHGDRFCDTPADPNLLGKVNGSCGYIGSALDANGMAYRPNTHNIMSYTSSACADTLTPMQLARVRAVALAGKRECCFVAPPLVRDTTVCRGESAILTAIGMGNEIRWYDAVEGGQPVGYGAVFVTPPVEESRAWYAEVVDSCVSNRARVVVRIALASGVIPEIARVVARPDTSARPSLFRIFANDDILLFQTSDGALWSSDGTSEGTRRVAQKPAGNEVYLTDAIIRREMVLYGVNDRGTGPMLFRTGLDGSGTTELLRITGRDGFSNFMLTALDSVVVFILNDGNDKAEIWRSDGTASGTAKVVSHPHTSAYNDFGLLSDGGVVYYQASDSLHGSELWRSDGTTQGTYMVADIAPGTADGDPGDFVLSDGMLYFSADDGAAGRELWVSDGTAQGTRLAADIRPGADSGNPGGLTALNGFLFLYADDGAHGPEPWISDGTPEGTRMIADIRKGNGSFPQHFIALQDRVFCVANDGSGAELWELLNGGRAGAAVVKDIHPFSGSGIASMISTGAELYFTANDAQHGNELWRSDGTVEGTRLVADIDSTASSSPDGLTMLAEKLVFFAREGSQGPALYTIAQPDVAVCRGESAILQVGNTNTTVRWYGEQSGGPVLHEGRTYQTAPLAGSRMYWAEVTNGSCVSARRAIPVRVLAEDPVITGPTEVTRGGDVTLEAVGGGGVVEWHAKDDGSALIDTGRVLLLSSMQSSVTVFARCVEGRCVSSFVPHRIEVRGSTNVPALAQGNTIELHPSPARDVLHIRLTSPFSGELRIVDLLGRTVHTQSAVIPDAHVVGVSRLLPGMYMLMLTNGAGSTVRPFMVAP
ncbi:MAG: T9SS type A sorting domain-containing protein [Bacteroidia bacterium]|nr:T9SS type A sorting domain-containing protein [Bacteroidia bacterium]